MQPPINYWTVVTAAAANVFVGFLWYGPLFGKTWASMAGVDLSKRPPGSKIAKSMFFMIAGSLIMAWVLDHALIFANFYLGSSGPASGLMVGALNWLGFIVPVTLGVVLWENKPWKLFILNAAYYLAALCLMGLILAAWA